MPTSYQPGEFNSFVGGLYTEASPLTFPENYSLDEKNFILNRDGSRSRRLGMDIENDNEITSVDGIADSKSIRQFVWESPGGQTEETFIAIQAGSLLFICDRNDPSLESSGWVKKTFSFSTLSEVNSNLRWGMASVDGKLVIVAGRNQVIIITYEDDDFTDTSDTIKIRDTFGLEGPSGLTEPDNINVRPLVSSLTGGSLIKHLYNLRNQGWALPRLLFNNANPYRSNTDKDYKVKNDPIVDFKAASSRPAEQVQYNGPDDEYYPSNADLVTPYIYANTALSSQNDPSDRSAFRFDRHNSFGNQPEKFLAPQGHFIIDLLDRGSSRQQNYNKLNADYYTNVNPTAIPNIGPDIAMDTPVFSSSQVLPDTTTQGATTVAEFAGRVFYAGFGNSVTGGDKRSPKLASYLFYSQTVKDEESILRCYQEGDPTSEAAPDLLDTDGGFIRIGGAKNIEQLIPLGNSLIVLADNGVWQVGGSDTGYFTANNQGLSKITEKGIRGKFTAVVVEGTIMYWSDDGIYSIGTNQFGSFEAKPVSNNIKTYLQEISESEKQDAYGVYDEYEKKVKWLYRVYSSNTLATTELVYDLVLQSFSPLVIRTSDSDSVFGGPFYKVRIPVNVGVFNTDIGNKEGLSSTAYITEIDAGLNNSTLKWSTYNNTDFKDWNLVDAEASLITGYLTGGDNMRFKQVPYIFFHMLRTETGFEDLGNDLKPIGESSCLVQSQWEWSNSATYGKWSKPFQAYRMRRQYMPDDENSSFDYGTATIVSKNKLRGRGRALSLYITTEEGKDLNLLGWSMLLGVNNNA